jgi:hypothetical protein
MISWGNTTDRILLLLQQEPMTKAEICRRLELTHDQVASVLSRLKRSKRIYICGHTRHAISGRTYIRPIYALGNKPDKVCNIKTFTLQERRARAYEKLLSARNNSIFNLTKTRRELQREKAKAVQAKANSHTYEQRAA